jgi:hypothetical protein
MAGCHRVVTLILECSGFPSAFSVLKVPRIRKRLKVSPSGKWIVPRGDEERLVVRPFLDWLKSEDWTITRVRVGNASGPDIEAVSPKGTKYLFEAKDHRTTTPSGTNPENTDMWTVLGQILTLIGKGDSEYGVVVPTSAKFWFERNLAEGVCEKLKLRVFMVSKESSGVSVAVYPRE